MARWQDGDVPQGTTSLPFFIEKLFKHDIQKCRNEMYPFGIRFELLKPKHEKWYLGERPLLSIDSRDGIF
jgi:hypothetical protein